MNCLPTNAAYMGFYGDYGIGNGNCGTTDPANFNLMLSQAMKQQHFGSHTPNNLAIMAAAGNFKSAVRLNTKQCNVPYKVGPGSNSKF